MASRLSEDPGRRVLLVEAGKDYATPELPPRIRDPAVRTIFAPELYWPDAFVETTAAESGGGGGGRVGVAMIARALGGGSLVNGLQSMRGLPRDYDEWGELGVDGWRAADVLSYFRKVERDLDFGASDEHGLDGPIDIQRITEGDWSALSLALRDALGERGLGRIADFNSATSADGTGPVPLNIGRDGRMAASTTYLSRQVRLRPNLQILTETDALRLRFENGHVAGVELRSGNHARTIRCRNVIVCAGALNSPAILMRSGIGPEEHLTECGIPVVVNRPGVGTNLVNHALLSINVHLRRRGRRKSRVRPPCLMGIRYSSNVRACASSDMFINVWERALGSLEVDPLSRHFGDIMLQLNKSYSRGTVTINPDVPEAMPKVRFNLLSDSRDRQRMAEGLIFVLSLLNTRQLRAVIDDAFLLRVTPFVLRLMQDTREAMVLGYLAAGALGGPRVLRRWLLRKNITPLDLSAMAVETGDKLAFENVIPAAHSAGTCRMGGSNDPQAVTDSRCRVIGVEGLRVVDASIFPTIMTAGTNLPVLMAAEKAAAMVIEDST
jgi:5-(hydroxymethyl)furfural/furfural oxidase